MGLLVVGMVLGPHSPTPLLTGHVEELQTVGEIGVILKKRLFKAPDPDSYFFQDRGERTRGVKR
jgi:hypothetical protein